MKIHQANGCPMRTRESRGGDQTPPRVATTRIPTLQWYRTLWIYSIDRETFHQMRTSNLSNKYREQAKHRASQPSNEATLTRETCTKNQFSLNSKTTMISSSILPGSALNEARSAKELRMLTWELILSSDKESLKTLLSSGWRWSKNS